MMKKYNYFCFILLLVIFVFPFQLLFSVNLVDDQVVKIHYLGHSSFVLQFDNGVSVVTDFGNYNAWGLESYIHDFGGLVPTIMTYSHTHHADHYAADRIPIGVQHILTEFDSLEIDGLTITPIRVCENSLDIEDNSAYLFSYKGFKFLHLGDAQIQIMNIEDQTVKEHIQNIIPDSLDLLFMTIEGQNQFISQAEVFVDLIQPKKIIPMHYWSSQYKSDFLAYLNLKNNEGKNYQIIDSSSSQLNISSDDSNDPIQVISLTRSPFVYTVKDYDGNVYETIKIGSQIWMKQNLNSTSYSNSTKIPGVATYGNDEANADIYGRLYTWDAAMKNSTIESIEGACPCGWHVPSDTEWLELENYLGGAGVAGSKMKTTGIDFWNTPNTDADNSSGFSALPGGEYDDHDLPNQFRLLNEYAVFWTSTEVSDTKARERYLSYNSAASSTYDWYKNMKYSIRCIKNILFYGFSFDILQGNTPLLVQFNDISAPSLLINSWEWDFDSDGLIDSYEQNPIWTYTEPGIYKITTTFISDTFSKTITHEDSIIVFNGESSIIFPDPKSVIKINPNPLLTMKDDWTFETWLNPTSLYGKYILDKNSVQILTNRRSSTANDNSLIVKLIREDGSTIRFSTEDSSLTLNKWQHIAIAYSYTSKLLDIDINGKNQSLSIDKNSIFDSPIIDNVNDTLLLGNNTLLMRALIGNLDELRLWNKYKTKEDLNENRYNYLTGNEEALVGYWKMNEGNGDTIYDSSVNNNFGKIENSFYTYGIDYSVLLDVKSERINSKIPTYFELSQNYPNPFNPSTTIKYSIPSNADYKVINVKLTMFDILGREVATLVNNNQNPGMYTVFFDASKLSSGIYFYKIIAGNFIDTKKMILLR